MLAKEHWAPSPAMPLTSFQDRLSACSSLWHLPLPALHSKFRGAHKKLQAATALTGACFRQFIQWFLSSSLFANGQAQMTLAFRFVISSPPANEVHANRSDLHRFAKTTEPHTTSAGQHPRILSSMAIMAGIVSVILIRCISASGSVRCRL